MDWTRKVNPVTAPMKELKECITYFEFSFTPPPDET